MVLSIKPLIHIPSFLCFPELAWRVCLPDKRLEVLLAAAHVLQKRNVAHPVVEARQPEGLAQRGADRVLALELQSLLDELAEAFLEDLQQLAGPRLLESDFEQLVEEVAVTRVVVGVGELTFAVHSAS